MKMRFRRRLLVLVAALVAFVAASGVAVALLFSRALEQTVALEASSGRILRAARELQFTVAEQRALFTQTVFLPPGPELDAARAEFAGGRDALLAQIANLRAAVRGGVELERQVEAYLGLLERQIAAADALPGARDDAGLAQRVAEGVRRAAQELDPPLHALIEQVRARQSSEMEATLARVRERVRNVAAGFVLVVLAAGGALFVYLDRAFGRPMARAIRTAREVAGGGMHQRIPLDRSDDFGVFAMAFNRMLEELTGINRRLADANRELESFSYTISHDLRAPLRAVTGFAAMLREDAAERLGPAELALLARIEAAALRMGGMIEDLLDIARIGRGELQRTDVDLSRLAEEVVAELRAADADRSVEVRIEPGIRAHCDPGLMRVVLDNLLGNAWKYTARTAAPRIEFGREGQGGEAGFFVRDNGAGFDPAFAERLFRPFQRLHGAEEFEGTGIGLATVDRIVTRHAGRVGVSARPGHGACFSVLLPAARALGAG